MVTCPETWAQSVAQEYRFAAVIHNLARTMAPEAVWGQMNGQTLPIDEGDGGRIYQFSDRSLLQRLYNVFAYARILSISVTIEWLGSVDNFQRVGTLEAQQTGPDLIRTAGLEYKKNGTSLRYKLCHERLNRMQEDNQLQRALAPMEMLGLDQLPVLYYPDKLHLDSGRGTVSGANLLQPGVTKVARFTPERRFISLKWKPLSRADKMASIFDISKVWNAGWDHDQRTGALWLGQDNWINSSTQNQPFDGLPLISGVTTCDFFRITYKPRWKFFKRIGYSQVMPDPPE